MADWTSFKPGSQKTPRMEQYADVIEWPNGEWKRVRPIGPLIGVPLARDPHPFRHCNISQNVPKLQPLHWQLQ